MKRLIALVTLSLILAVTPVKAETVSTCSSVYGGGEVCGETTTTSNTTVEHTVVDTGLDNTQILKIIASVAGCALIASVLYKLTYKSYILG